MSLYSYRASILLKSPSRLLQTIHKETNAKGMNMFFKTQEKNKKFQLVRTLTQFGLNPQEWHIEETSEEQPTMLNIVCKNDPQFQFTGYLKNLSQWQWDRLELKSI